MTGTAIRTDYSTRSSRDWYDDFDRSDWERISPNWEDHGAAGRNGPPAAAPEAAGPPPADGVVPAAVPLPAGTPPALGRAAGTETAGPRRTPGEDRPARASAAPRVLSRRSAVQLVPIILGLVVIVLAALVIPLHAGRQERL